MIAGYLVNKRPIFSLQGCCNIRCISFVLISKKYGVMIFDTGSPTEPEKLLVKLKNNFDITPDKVKWVFNTHVCHPDHTGANSYFKKAKVVLSRKDYEMGRAIADVVNSSLSNEEVSSLLLANYNGFNLDWQKYDVNQTRHYMRLYCTKNLGDNITFIEDDPDLPDFVKILFTPGHTDNCYSFIVKDKIFIVGDALSKRLILEDIENATGFEEQMDLKTYKQTIKKIIKFKGIIVPGHDTPFFSNTETLQSMQNKIFEV